jgi:type IV pilus assembly protein PilB
MIMRNGPSAVPTSNSAGHDARVTADLLWEPERQTAIARPTFQNVLLDSGAVSPETLTQANGVLAKTPGRALHQVLIEVGADETAVYQALAKVHDLAFEHPSTDSIQEDVFNAVGSDFARQQGAIGLRRDERNRFMVGLTDPANVFLLDALRRKVRREVIPVVVTPSSIARLCEAMAGDKSAEDAAAIDSIISEVADDDVSVVDDKQAEVEDLEKAGQESPVIRFVNYLIADAIKQGASDIHIEPKEKALHVRYRIDGVLFSSMNPPYSMAPAITSRLKIMGNLDIAERRLPQDGRIRAVVQGRKIDLRMSTLPTANGEKTVIRVLDNRSINVPLEALGFSEEHYATWRELIDEPHGILLVTGPTGSGKTTTLYSSLRCLDGNKLNISTVEDPVEYHLGQANQVQVSEKIGMTFSAALRSLLRQDPDVVMLGEIRDAETARIAVQASLTGHLVLSTLHTNDAPASITRLINIGVEPYLISAAVNGILAQRLVRKICQSCKQPHTPSDELAKVLLRAGFTGGDLFKGAGCDKCRQTGYSGRVGIYELLKMDDALRDAVTTNPDVNVLRRMCRDGGLKSLREDGWRKVKAGMTTVDEVLRVTESI